VTTATTATGPTTVERTCRTCPSFLTGAAQTNALSTNIASPVCGLKMLPLIQPVQGADTSRRVLKKIAANCGDFGYSGEITPLGPNSAPILRVGMDAEAASAHRSFPDASDAPNCISCVNYVDQVEVKKVTGWTGSLCRATGSLMPNARLNLYAQKCGTFRRQVGIRPVDPLKTFVFFPQYSATFGEIDVAQQYESSLTHFVDPKDYQTDRPVSDAMRLKRGIRAWRKVEDPKGYGEPVYLPIFDRDAMVLTPDGKSKKRLFDDDDLDLIPNTGDREAPEDYADHGGLLYTFAVLFMKLDEVPAAWGAAGTGKTEMGRWIAWKMQAPFRYIGLDGSSEIDSVAGKMLFENGETVAHLGELPIGWSRPGILLADEPNTAPAEIWQLFRPLMDNRKTLKLAHLHDQKYYRHDDCYFFMAMNPQWGVLNVGAQMIADADNSRMSHVFFDYPPEELEIKILQRRVERDRWVVPEKQMKSVMAAAKELRESAANGVLHTSWGLRHQIKLVRSLRYFDPVTAYRRAIGDALEPAQWEAMTTTINSHFTE